MSRAAAVEAYVGLGGNVGDRLGALRTAARALAALPGTEAVAASPVYETEAHVRPGTPPQPDHLNAVVALRTRLGAHDLLRHLHAIERAAGRDPEAAPWSPRPLDLDLLLYGTAVIEAEGLVVPHPRLAERQFVLRPLADLAPRLVVPRLGETVEALLQRTPDRAGIRPTSGRLGGSRGLVL
ncbi:MAG: 2-amino-4-hydroxy-6-hydroxymethyldihydropteridine diphosphokinase [Bacteroidota bacterium]